jgi:hypothetical protein
MEDFELEWQEDTSLMRALALGDYWSADAFLPIVQGSQLGDCSQTRSPSVDQLS